MNKRLLVIDDNEEVLRQLRWGFSAEGYAVHQALNVKEALAIQRKEAPQVVTLDLGLPPDAEGRTEGFRCLDALLAADPLCKVIVVTGHHENDNAQRSIRNGAYDFCRKPVDLEELKVIVRRAFFLYGLEKTEPEKPSASKQQELLSDKLGIITQAASMQALLANLGKIAISDAPVLITGESGTGKELAARAIHTLSARRDGPLITVNCGAIPEHLLESEFFGHEKGAFTGATQRVQGKIEFADNGTLFLDEIGELPPPLQVKLLRFLQEMIFQRVGGRQDIEVNVRIVAATNRDLPAMVRSGQFREDMYYRIGVVNVALPPLRERGKDVLLLAAHFIAKYDISGKIRGLHSAAERAMQMYHWPGNVRELENKIRRAIILSDGPVIKLNAIDLSNPVSARDNDEFQSQLSLQEARSAVEKKLLLEALNRYSGNIMQASQALGVSRPTFYDLLKKHKINV